MHVPRKKRNESQVTTKSHLTAEKSPADNLTVNETLELQYRFTSDETKFGEQVHLALSLMRDASDLERALKTSSCTYGFMHNADHMERVRTAVMSTWELMRAKGWTEGYDRVETEPEFCDASGAVYRADRIMIKGTAVTVLDFKTGEPEKSHHEQVRTYCRLLLEAGFSEAEGHLVYTRSGITETVRLNPVLETE